MTSTQEAHHRGTSSTPANSTVRRWLGRWGFGPTLAALGVTLLFIVSSASASPVAQSTHGSGPAAPTHVVPVSLGSSGAPVSAGASGTLRPDTTSIHTGGRTLQAPAFAAAKAAPPATGRGAFFQSTLLPHPANGSCISYYGTKDCYNNTNEPSLNLTTKGLLAVAYTAYTNESPCKAMQGNATTEVGFSASKNLGSTWSTPIYLGNPVCKGVGQNFSSAAQPSLSSLANGTLVLSYEEFNFSQSSYSGYAAPEFYCYELYWDRIVETQSYNNGTSWSTPVVLDTVNNSSNGSLCGVGGASGYPDLQPWVTAFGQTIYVAWTNVSNYYCCYYYFSEEVFLRASTDGGATWGAAVEVPPIAGGSCTFCTPSSVAAAMNPAMTVTPNGTLLIAYLTGMGILSGGNYSGYQGGQIELAWSSNNGSTFSKSEVAGGVVTNPYVICCHPGIFMESMPSIAYSASTKQIFVAWSSIQYIQGCEYYGYFSYCSSNIQVMPLTVANSSTAGATWSTHLIMSPLITVGGASNYLYNPSIAVTSNGVLHLQSTYSNDSVCYPNSAYYLGTACGVTQQVYLNSSDNGTTWTLPVYVYYNYSGCGYPYMVDCSWAGQYSTMVPAGNTVFLAWTWQFCPPGTGYGTCEWYYNPGNATVVVSQLFTGTGISLTFTETGLPTGLPSWSVNVMGNVRAGSPATSLVVSGVPASQIVAFASPWVHNGWGVVYESALGTASPSSFAASTTISVTFTEYVKFNLFTTPLEPSNFFAPSGTNYYSDISISPLPGGLWILPGTAQSITITPFSNTNCYVCTNLSFVSWTGSGPGNVTTLSQNITVTPTGPVNETANFNIIRWCYHVYIWPTGYTWVCLNNTYYPLTFTQDGLPANVTWDVTLLYQNGTAVTNSSSSDSIGFIVPTTPTYFYVWTVPSTGGKFWVPSTTPGSPVAPLSVSFVAVSFTLMTAASATFPTRFVESGLPAGTPWTIVDSGRTYGVESNNTTLLVPGGGPYALNASFVYLETGYGFYAGNVTVTSYVANQTAAVTKAAGASVYLNGSGEVLITFKPMYLLTTTASVGGSVTPASQWVVGGRSVTLGEHPAAKYHFVGWTGVGTGATTTAQDSTTAPTITPGGPVTEFATFRPNFPPTWNVTVNAVGLPLGTTFDFAIGGSSYSASGTVKVGEIVGGNYSVNVPYVYLNSTQTTRFVPTTIASSLSFNAAGLLEITKNGSLNLTYVTQYLLQFTVTPAIGGSITPAPGATWYNALTLLTLTATAARGYYFVSWNSTSQTLSTKLKSTTLSVTGPDAITAQFIKRPIQLPATYWINVSESGLPNGLTWNVSLGAYGASGANGTLQVVGLNGSYTLAVPVVSGGLGVRYTSASNGTPQTVTSNSTLQVVFVKQYLLTISSTVGGTITPGASEWVVAGVSVTLTATPNATSKFANWTGSGHGNYTGTATTTVLTVNGPITEAATFSPVYVQKVSTVSAATTGNLSIAFGLLAALLVLGLVVGLVVGRRRQRGPPAVQAWEQGDESSAPAGGAIYDESGEPAPEGPG